MQIQTDLLPLPYPKIFKDIPDYFECTVKLCPAPLAAADPAAAAAAAAAERSPMLMASGFRSLPRAAAAEESKLALEEEEREESEPTLSECTALAKRSLGCFHREVFAKDPRAAECLVRYSM